MSPLTEAAVSLLLLAGGTFALIGSFGLAKLSNFYLRLHGPTKATTLGIGSALIASMLYSTSTTGQLTIHELLVTLFLFLTAPVSAYVLVQAALIRDADSQSS